MPRQFERIFVSLEAMLESSSAKGSARISDLSMEGCFVDTILSPTQGEIIFFEIKIPASTPLSLSGEVTYVMPQNGFGVRFRELSDDEKDLLKQIILAYGGNPNSKSN